MAERHRDPSGRLCEEFPPMYRAVQNTVGFEHLPQSAQTATIEFAHSCWKFVNNPSVTNGQRLSEALAQVDKSDGIKALAFEVGLRLVAETFAEVYTEKLRDRVQS